MLVFIHFHFVFKYLLLTPHFRSGAFLHLTKSRNVLILCASTAYRASLSAYQKVALLPLKNFLLYKFHPLPVHTNTYSVLGRLQLAPGELVLSVKTQFHQTLTCLALSFRSQASIPNCLIQIDSGTLRYFPFIWLLNISARHNRFSFFIVTEQSVHSPLVMTGLCVKAE